MSRVHDMIQQLAPEGVEHSRIGDIADVSAGATPASRVADYWEGGTIPWMSSGEVNKGTIYDTDTKITQAGYNSCSTKMVPPNSVVMALAGQGKTRGLVARTRIALCTNQSLAAIVPKHEVDSDFLYYYLSTQYQMLRGISSGDGTRGGLNLQLVRAYRVPVPPVEVQREIVRILDAFTPLEGELGAELAAELEVRRRQFSHYLDWVLLRSAVTGSTFAPLNDVLEPVKKISWADYGDSALRYIDLASVDRNTHEIVKTDVITAADAPDRAQQIVVEGDVLFGTTRPTLKRYCLIAANLDGHIASTGYCVLRPQRDVLSPRYLFYVLGTSAFSRFVEANQHGAGYPGIPDRIVKQFRIALPPMDEQRRSVTILDGLDRLARQLSVTLTAELAARRSQYEHYRDRLLTFKEAA